MLKPELSNLSVRIVAKTAGSKSEQYEYLGNVSFEESKQKFSNDKTCFLRIIQKEAFLTHLEYQLHSNEIDEAAELKKTLKRYFNMMKFLDHYLNKSDDANEFCLALRATEVFQTYECLKNRTTLSNLLNE
jgi:hypothetical protein